MKLIESDPREVLDNPDLPLQPPSLVAPINEAVITGLKVTFRWNEVTGVDNYELLVAKDPNFTQVVNGYRGPTRSFTATLPEKGDYYWKVRATNTEIGPWSSVWKLTATEVTLDIPQLVSPKEGETLEIMRLEWTPVGGATGYDIQLSKTIDFSVVYKVFNSDKNNITEVIEDGSYYWRVRAKNATLASDFSMIRSFTVKKKELPGRTFSVVLDGNYTIWYTGQSGGNVMAKEGELRLLSGINAKANVLNVKQLTVRVKEDELFDEVYANVSSAVKRFFTNRGLGLKINDAKAAHDATILFLHLLIRKEIPTFEVIEMISEDRGRKQV